MKQIKYLPALIAILFCVAINNSYASNKTITQKTKVSEIKKFLFTDPLKINFDNADKYLLAPISKEEGGWMSKPITIEGSVIAYFVSLYDKKNFYYRMFFDVKNCGELPSLIKKAYGKDFVYYLDGKAGGKVFILEGSIDIRNWRVFLSCIENNASASQNDELSPAASYINGIKGSEVIMVSGSKNNIKKILKRQSIECNFTNGVDAVLQIDESNKLLRGQDGLPFNTIKFDDDFIITSDNNSKGFKIDRKTGSINMSDSFFGTCKKRSSEKKF